MFPAEWWLLMDFIKSKNVLRALAVIPDMNTPHLYSCLHTLSLGASQRNTKVRWKQIPSLSLLFLSVLVGNALFVRDD